MAEALLRFASDRCDDGDDRSGRSVSPRTTSFSLRHSRCSWSFLWSMFFCQHVGLQQAKLGLPVFTGCGPPVLATEPLCGFSLELQFWYRQ